MTVHSRCNYTGLFSKRIPTRSIGSVFAPFIAPFVSPFVSPIIARLSRFGRR
ncbi:hypothetical protein IM543_18480 [Massilia sp. UMI-21]|nr:hypothetical protein IM543_18480 [Massilia sp. UMI-21]